MARLGARVQARPQLWVWLLVAALTATICYPILWLVFGSNIEIQSTLAYLTSPRIVTLLTRTLLLAGATTVVACVIGIAIAFLVARTDLPGKQTVTILVLASYMSPSFLLAFAYVMLLGPRSGVVNRVIEALTGQAGFFDIYSYGGFVLIAAFEAVPIVFLTVVGTFASMHGPLEDGAEILGARRWKILATVTFPLARPAIMASVLLVFVHVLSIFGVPAILNIAVVTTEIQAVFTWPPRFDRAAALSLVLIAIALVVVYLYRRLTAGQERYATVTGRWVPPKPLALGVWRYPVLALVLAYLGIAVILPYAMLIFASLTVTWTAGFSAENFTFGHYREVLADQYNVRAIRNSILLGVGAASAGVVVGAMVAYVDVRMTGFRGRSLLDYIASIPWGLPSIALGAGLILAFTHPPVLYGTLWILLLSYFIKFLPLSVRTATSSLRQVSRDLEQASRISGANAPQTLARITIPLIRSGLIAGWLLIFFPSLTELSSSILLVSPGKEVIATAALGAWESINLENATALGVITLLLSVVPWLVLPSLRRGALNVVRSAER